MTTLKVVAAIVAAAMVVFLLMPSERVEGIKETWLRFSDDPGQLCLDHEKKLLKDPASARLVSVSAIHEMTVTIAYRAKNGYGGYDQSEAICLIGPDGKVNELTTRILRDSAVNEKVMNRLDAQSRCLERRNALISRGVDMAEATRAAGGPCESRP